MATKEQKERRLAQLKTSLQSEIRRVEEVRKQDIAKYGYGVTPVNIMQIDLDKAKRSLKSENYLELMHSSQRLRAWGK